MYDSVLRIYNQKLKYLNYSNRTIEVYTHVSSRVLGKVPLPM